MFIEVIGNGGVIAAVDGSTMRSLVVTRRPIDYGSYGCYKFSLTVPIAASQVANSELFSFRWSNTVGVKCILDSISLSLIQTAAATATIFPAYQCFRARRFIESPTAGTSLSMGNSTYRKNNRTATNSVGDASISSAAAGLTIGSRQVYSQAFLTLLTNSTITTPNPRNYFSKVVFDSECQEVFDANEGFVLIGPTTAFGVAGTATLRVDMAWTEAGDF